jgi:hypothetical protein
MYDERVNDPALALMALDVPFCLLGVHWPEGRLVFMGAQSVGKCINIDTLVAGCCPCLWGHWILPWRGKIYLLKPRAQHEWARLFSLHPTLSIVLAISFGYFLASDLALYHTYVFYHHRDRIEEDLENERKIKNQACPQTRNFHVLRQMCSMHRK